MPQGILKKFILYSIYCIKKYLKLVTPNTNKSTSIQLKKSNYSPETEKVLENFSTHDLTKLKKYFLNQTIECKKIII